MVFPYATENCQKYREKNEQKGEETEINKFNTTCKRNERF